MARVEMIDVSRRWIQVTAVDRISLCIEDGEFVAILGPSGCGKSSTLFLLAGIYTPSGGELINEVEAEDRNVGVVFQSYARARSRRRGPARCRQSGASHL